MSLISQKDRELAIKAISYYNDNFSEYMLESERMEVNALLNWIKLEHSKNDNQSVV